LGLEFLIFFFFHEDFDTAKVSRLTGVMENGFGMSQTQVQTPALSFANPLTLDKAQHFSDLKFLFCKISSNGMSGVCKHFMYGRF
jgi:hypothetical protein